MKKIIVTGLIYILSSIITFSQETIPNKQFMLWCTSVGSTEEVTHYINAAGKVWEYNSGNFIISSDQEIYSNSLITIGNANFNSNDWPGLNFSWLDVGIEMPRWGLGLYEVTNSKQTYKYFYLDSRDSDFGGYEYLPDFYIYFDNSEGVYKYKDVNDNWITISQAELVRIWDIHNEPHNTSGLQNFWSNALAAVNDGNDHPQLVWGPHPTLSGSINYYKIYYSYHITGQPPGTFYLLETVNSDVFEYTDMTVEMGNDYRSKSYYVTGVYDDIWETLFETSPTNTVTVVLAIPHKRSDLNYNKRQNSVFSLEQNYPNPFNPETKISFMIAENSFITLKVYDVLGNEVANLLNETKGPGHYFVSFDASGFPSGIYFYKLNANGYTLTKKMLIAK